MNRFKAFHGIFFLLSISACVTIEPMHPKDFVSASTKKKIKITFEWGSVTKMEAEGIVFERIKINWMKGDSSTSGFKIGKFGKRGEESTIPYSFSVKFRDGQGLAVTCDTSQSIKGHGYGSVWLMEEKRTIGCTIRQKSQIYTLQLNASRIRNFEGELRGNGTVIRIKPNMFDIDGQEFSSPVTWDMTCNDHLMASMRDQFEPDFWLIEKDNRCTQLATAAAGAIKLALITIN